MLEAFSRWLGKQSVARLLLVGVAAAALFGVGVLLADKSKSPPRMLGVLGGVAVVSFGLALVRYFSSLSIGKSTRKALLGSFGVLVLVGVGCFVGWKWYDGQTAAMCTATLGEPSLEKRTQGLRSVEGHSFLDSKDWRCGMGSMELRTLQEEGQCPKTMPVIAGVPCSCGDQQWPKDWSGEGLPSCGQRYHRETDEYTRFLEPYVLPERDF